jgi:glycosyltransferase involved in cell wall biosynthesis
MSEMILFSIVIAVHNGERFIGETLDSILSQTYNNFEVIIVNDRSTDRTIEIIEQYKKQDLRICLIQNKSESGPSHVRNYGISKAIGKWIAICDADDLWKPEKLQTQADFISSWQAEIPIIALGTSGYVINEASKPLNRFSSSVNTIEEFNAFKSSCEPFLGFLHSSVVFNKDTFKQIGGYRSDYIGAEDADLMTRFLDAGVVLNIDCPLTLYRKHLGSWQLDNTIKQANNVERIKENINRRRNGINELTYEDFFNSFQKKMSNSEMKAYLRKNKGKYLFRVGAINLANNHYILGFINLLLALAYDQQIVLNGLRNAARFKTRSVIKPFKES